MTDSFNFDFAPVEIPVTVNGVAYVLQDASAGDAAKFKNRSTSGILMEDGKVVGVKGVGELNCYLVSLCLKKADEKRTPVPLDVISKWPERVVKPLAAKAAEISELNETETEESLVKKINELNKQLETIRESKKALGNGLSNTEASSD